MQKTKLIKKCRACNSKKLINILSLGRHYLPDFAKKRTIQNKFPLTLVLCANCSLLQLKHTVSKFTLYNQRYGYKSGINQTMRNELKEIAEESIGNIKSKDKIVAVDIGANDGTLLSNYDKDIFKIGVEPVEKFVEDCKKHADLVINDFFNIYSYLNKANDKKAHIVTAISCFYDIDNPNKFLSDIKKILHKDGILVIQQNYLVEMLENNAFDNVVHEHLEYYSLSSLEKLLKRHNLEIFNVKLSNINGGSFRTFIAHKGKKTIRKSVYELRETENKLKLKKKQIYDNFARRIKENRKEVYNLVTSLVKKNKKIYAYGASTRGNTLLQYFKLNSNFIKKAVERNAEKWGKKITSLNIPIISEDEARRNKPDYMLVLPWFFKEEFLQREKKYLQSGGHFIFPLPKVLVI